MITSDLFAEIKMVANHLTYMYNDIFQTFHETPLIMSHIRHMVQYQLLDWQQSGIKSRKVANYLLLK